MPCPLLSTMCRRCEFQWDVCRRATSSTTTCSRRTRTPLPTSTTWCALTSRYTRFACPGLSLLLLHRRRHHVLINILSQPVKDPSPTAQDDSTWLSACQKQHSRRAHPDILSPLFTPAQRSTCGRLSVCRCAVWLWAPRATSAAARRATCPLRAARRRRAAPSAWPSSASTATS